MAAKLAIEAQRPFSDGSRFFKQAVVTVKYGKKPKERKDLLIGHAITGGDGKKYIIILIEKEGKEEKENKNEIFLWCMEVLLYYCDTNYLSQ